MADKDKDKDKTSWRKKLHVSRPKTPKPLDLDEPVIERRKPHSHHGIDVSVWRKTLQGSRPATPSEPLTPLEDRSSTVDDSVDVGPPEYSILDSKASTLNLEALKPSSASTFEASRHRPSLSTETSRLEESKAHLKPSSKPKGARAWTNIFPLGTGLKPPEPLEDPWAEVKDPALEPDVDPMIIMLGVTSRLMHGEGAALPKSYNPPLLRLIEDYRKIREEKERLEQQLREEIDRSQKAKAEWAEREHRYTAETERLRLGIERKHSWTEGMNAARQSRTLNQRAVRWNLGEEEPKNDFDKGDAYLSMNELDETVVKFSRKASLRQPSPSGRMTALSRQLENSNLANDLPVGTPPIRDPVGTLSRKVKSELELSKFLANAPRPSDSSNSATSAFSTPGDLLPDELEQYPDAVAGSGQGDPLLALRDISILVARRKGLAIDDFLPKLMKLLDEDEDVESASESSEDAPTIALEKPRGDNDCSPSLHPTGDALSQSVLGPDGVRRRHFSFEPGDDELASLDRSLSAHRAAEANQALNQRRSNMTPGIRTPGREGEPELSLAKKRSTAAEDRMRSRIPSPVQTGLVAHGRRMASSGSSSAVVTEDDMHRQDSSSSVLTAIRSTPVKRQKNGLDRDSLAQPENQEVKGQTKSTPSRKSTLDRSTSRTGEVVKWVI